MAVGGFAFATPVSRHHQNSAPSCHVRHFEVRVTVAYNPGGREIQAMFARGPLQQSGIWFAALARIFRLVRAKINSVNPSAARGKLRNHFFVDLLHEGFRKNIARHSRLVGDHDDGNVRQVQLTDGVRRERKNPQAVNVVDVPHFLADGAIAVQEHSFPKSVELRHSACSLAGESRPHSECVVLRKRQHRPKSASCTGDPRGIAGENTDYRKQLLVSE